MRSCVFALVSAAIRRSALLLAAPQPPVKTELAAVLDRAGWYLDYFVDEFENVVAEERYTQDSSQPLASFSPVTGGRGGAVQRAVAFGHARARATAICDRTSCS